MTSPSGPTSGGERRPPSAASRFRLRFEKFTSFVEEYGSHISLGGIFLKTEDPRPVGSEVAFEVELTDGYRLLEGSGEVVWIRRQPRGPEAPAGMALRFQTLDQQGRELVLKMLEEQVKAGGEPFEPDRIPGDAETGAAAAGAPAAGTPVSGPEQPQQAALEFDAPWGDRLPEMPAEMLDEDVEDDEEPTIVGSSQATHDATAAAEQAVRELEVTPDFELASESNFELGEIEGDAAQMPDFTAGEGDAGDLFDVGESGELPPEPSFELEEAGDEAEASFASVSAVLSEPRQMESFDLEPEDQELEDDEPTLISRGGAAPPEPPGEAAEDDDDPTLVTERSPDLPPSPPAEEPARPLTDVREARFPESTPPPAAGFSPLPGGDRPAPLPASEPPPPVPSAPPDLMAEPPVDEADPFVDLDPPVPEYRPSPELPPPETTGPLEDYEHELDDSGVSRQRKGVPKGVWALLLLVGIAAAGYLLRDELLELVGLDGSGAAPPIVASAAPEPPPADARLAEPEVPEGSEEIGAAPEQGSAAAASEPAVAEPVREPAVAAAAEPEPPPPAETPRRQTSPDPAVDRSPPPPRTRTGSRPAGPRATRMEDVTWRSTGEGTVLTLRFDGELDAERVTHDPLGWAPDREQVVVAAISSPYRLGAIDVRSPELTRIRTGVHPSDRGGSELRLVFDLGSPRAGIATVRTLGDRVEILIRGR